ncbi:unnamed protein product [Zymoseptoria tritici ST99CH_1E4]|uniref:Large ribosomal subunit protein mL46 n=1 Tax=Zymoseptoria tritici ST99CH_1E4 TaxID=1276532 RepID=A0A2H1G652_ZYMTR|nr:unnamed protein product [Zymoseptoria tritici ST99CH_1E4]
MNAGQKSVKRVAAANVLSRDTVCISCRYRIANAPSRRHASAAAAVAEQPAEDSHQSSNTPAQATGPKKAFRLVCGTVVSRPPVLTRELTSFEKAFFLYQKRLNERLALPFTRYFYIKKDTPADIEWKRKAAVRKTAARDVGVYNAYSDEGWNDEVLAGSTLSEPEDIVEKLIRDAEGKDIIDADPVGDEETKGRTVSGKESSSEGVRKPVGEVSIDRPLSRRTKDDEENNTKSLNRRLDRNLYLLVKNKHGHWRFPQDRLYAREGLHQAAERVLLQAGGINMNTWVVGNHPIGYYMNKFAAPILSKILPNRLVSATTSEKEQQEFGEKVFFMKVRIFAGQTDLKLNELGDTEYEWLVKEEIEERVSKKYWMAIRNMLSAR